VTKRVTKRVTLRTRRSSQDDALVKAASKIADAIGRTFGSGCEIAVHDLRDPTHSLVHLVNGDVTGRQLGAPIRDLIQRVLPDMDAERGGLFNYRTVLADGRSLKSSTCLLRNDKDEPLVAFCVNIDVTALDSAVRALNQLTQIEDVGERREREQGQSSARGGSDQDEVTRVLRHLVINIVRPAGRPSASLTKPERLAIVEFLEKRGAFSIKGSVQLVAREMGTSQASVYRYIDQARYRIAKGQDGQRAGWSDRALPQPATEWLAAPAPRIRSRRSRSEAG
jgi:predicted transcriptional regulator YheO